MLNEENMTFKEKLKGYKIKEKIGVGSYGKVYKVEKENIIYVLKQIPLNNATDIESIKNEATILSSLNSEYVVKYYESFIEDNNLNIIMEYCEGGDLSTYMKQYKAKFLSNKSYNSFSSLILPENLIWKMFIQISLGLYHIHKKKILHRDLKTLNIFLTKDYNCKIGDLGVAKILNGTNHANTFVGTPYYLSPEICEEKPYNEKSDVWALGCILYEMVTFKHPFNASNQAALYIKILKGKYENINVKCSNDIRKIIDLLLEKNYYKRPFIKDVICMNAFIDNSKKFGIYDKMLPILERRNVKKILLDKDKLRKSNSKSNERQNSGCNLKTKDLSKNSNNNNFITNNNVNYRDSKVSVYLKNSPSRQSNQIKTKQIIFKPDLINDYPKTPTKYNEKRKNSIKQNLTPIKIFPRDSKRIISLNSPKSSQRQINNKTADIINPEDFLLQLQSKMSSTLQNISVADFLDEKTTNNNNDIIKYNYKFKSFKVNSNMKKLEEKNISDDEIIDNNSDNYFTEITDDKSNLTNDDNSTDDKTMCKDEIIKNEKISDLEKYKKKYNFYLEEVKKYKKEVNIDKIFEKYVEIQNDNNDNIDNVINNISNYLRKVIPMKQNEFIDLLINLYKYENLCHNAEK
jgi:NIMA (never in mitosis gene a)-related kinase